ncbi:MAG TPA: JAB domain-containing protein [Polyangia bacterium]|jgi:DNA repair protein RadC|nr:JAB domain-containing protein [Polyangia bacterium]
MARYVRDLTYQETIYKWRLRTITVRRELPRDPFLGSISSLKTLRGAGEIEDVLRCIFNQYDDEQEHFVMVIVSPADEVVGFKLLASGTQTSVMVDRRLVFKNALFLGARAIILAHNHPNGSLIPSATDLELTKALAEGARLLGIEVLDHIILTPNGTCASIKEREPHLFPAGKVEPSGQMS